MAFRQIVVTEGTTFNRWTVIREVAHSVYNQRQIECRCVCGTIKVVGLPTLIKGTSKSCGCLRPDVSSVVNRTHGASKTVEYKTWSGIKKRCYQPNCKSYPNYGGRGITVCDEWLDDFPRFLADMGQRPVGGTIERIDNDGPYAPDNCRWATKYEQSQNTRHNRHITFNGETLTISGWARRLGEDVQTILKRLRRGWPLDVALTTKGLTDQTRLTNRYLEFSGERHCVTEWGKITGIPHATISARLRMGWPLERVLTQPLQRHSSRP